MCFFVFESTKKKKEKKTKNLIPNVVIMTHFEWSVSRTKKKHLITVIPLT